MKFVLYTIFISPHQIPLACELIKHIGVENFRYIYRQKMGTERLNLGWRDLFPEWCLHVDEAVAKKWLEDASVLLSGERDFDLFARRARRNHINLYMSERWFKPPLGAVRLLHPRFLGYAWRLVQMARRKEVFILPIGVHAQNDFRRIGIKHSAMFSWGYFVEPTAQIESTRKRKSLLSVLWVGRMLPWKRVDTIIRACAAARKDGFEFCLDLIGDGVEKTRLVKLVQALEVVDMVRFLPPVAIDRIRSIMGNHDIYVLASDAGEGWGAALNEAMEEGMVTLGTYEAGASATMLPHTHMFHAGNWRALAVLLKKVARSEIRETPIGNWTPSCAAERLLEFVQVLRREKK